MKEVLDFSSLVTRNKYGTAWSPGGRGRKIYSAGVQQLRDHVQRDLLIRKKLQHMEPQDPDQFPRVHTQQGLPVVSNRRQDIVEVFITHQ